MHVTCGLILVSPTNKILVVHPTNGRHWGGWSIPKGLRDHKEELIDAALRELHEETSLDYTAFAHHAIPLGQYKYTREKDIFYVKLRTLQEHDAKKLFCESIVPNTSMPEVDDFKFVDFETLLTLLNKKQAAIVETLRDAILA